MDDDKEDDNEKPEDALDVSSRKAIKLSFQQVHSGQRHII